MSLSREKILSLSHRPRELVPVPEWEGEVWVSVMSGEERDAWEVEIIKDRDKSLQNMRAKLVAICATDDTGNKLFNAEDVPALGRLSWLALQRLSEVAQRINKLAEKDMEDLKGNSVPNPSDEPLSA